MNQKELTPEDKTELERLNQDVEDAIKARTEWLDKKMTEYAAVPVGGDLYNLDTGLRLGKVSKHYRYWADQNKLLDTRLHIHYEYQQDELYPSGNVYDNTSRQVGVSIGTKQDAIEWANWRVEKIK